MKIIRFITLLLWVAVSGLSPVTVSAQSAAEMAERIMKDNDYLYGEGWGRTVSAADKQALANLTSKIAVNISSTFTIEENETLQDGQQDNQTLTNHIVNSYSQASLTNTFSLVLSNDPEVHVMRYVKKSEISKIFEQRKDKVYDLLRSAVRSESQAKIDNALRCYYWALNLMKSLQYPNELTFKDKEGTHLLAVWIPEQINQILANLKAEIADRKDHTVSMMFSYKGRPVSSLDYTFFDGLQWSSVYSAKDGLGTIELRPNSNLQNISLKYEYEYLGEAHIDKEVEGVLELFKATAFGKATQTVNLNPNGQRGKKSELKKQFEALVNTASELNAEESKQKETKRLAEVITQVVKSVSSKDSLAVKSYFSQDGWRMYMELLAYGHAQVIGNPQFSFYPVGEEMVCRSIPMSFAFKNNRKKFVEHVTFTFNKERKIDALAFALDKEAMDFIFSHGNAFWPESAKMTIATFLENYKTAFALKRLDYIKTIFDDNAVIITGHIVKPQKSKQLENEKYLANEHVKYNRHSKESYLKNLEHCFGSNEYINIRFTDNYISKGQKGGETYGIQIHQDYYSSTYGDSGYLFLLVDLNNPKQPTIHVRTWQPNRDPNLTKNMDKDDPDYGLYSLGFF